MGSPSIFLFPLLESVRDILNLLGKEPVIQMTDTLCPVSCCNNYIKVKNALMSKIVTEERYNIYKIWHRDKETKIKQVK